MVGVTVATLPRGRCHQQAMSDTQVRMMKMVMRRRRMVMVMMMMMRWRRSHVGKAMSVTKVIPVIMFVVMAITG